jgi:hypothetical protein
MIRTKSHETPKQQLNALGKRITRMASIGVLLFRRGQMDTLSTFMQFYRTKSALTAAKIAVKWGHIDMRSMIECPKAFCYISTMVLTQLTWACDFF